MAGEKHGERSGLMIASLVIIAGVALGAALIYARAVLIPFVLALFICVLVGPLLDFLVIRLKIRRGQSRYEQSSYRCGSCRPLYPNR